MITVLLYVVGVALIASGFPVEGIPGAMLALAGAACCWIGWRRTSTRGDDR